MKLPSRDQAFLDDRGYDWELLSESAGGYLIVRNFDVTGGGFAPSPVTLMIRIPPQFPMTPLDMWYCNPPIRIAESGHFAPASEVMESHVGKNWQRFSRHLNGGWRPGVDGLRSFFVLIQRELQGLGSTK
ncbi:E2/UBC family protein [Cognatiluteimonas telluris]|uniref:E2/UBC family protein n=1 Tax=Cognatiluteimonas telluris TaxID=1104775 RepID=UPI00140CC693|nr:E2/UBC family protein [Lysobacter telluris]